jgi:uncharacterized protein with GYD domain
MPLYMTQFGYTPETWRTLVSFPEDRRKAVSAMLAKLGGKLVGLYYSFGEYDGVVLFEAPDDTSAAAAVMAVLTPGHVRTTKTTKLLTVEEMMEALGKAGSVEFQAPGGTG